MTTTPQLKNIDACVFDAYGTLFDFNSAASAARDELGEDWQRLSDLWRLKQLQYTWPPLLAHHANVSDQFFDPGKSARYS